MSAPVMFAVLVGSLHGDDELEAKVKAAFIYNFALFTTWPELSWSPADGDLVIGVVGRDPLAQRLRSIQGKRVGGRKVVVVSRQPDQALEQCHILYVGRTERARARTILRTLRESPVLTVGDGEGFIDQGGMVQLYIEDEAVRFEVCLPCARDAGIQLSANMLQVAKLRREKSP